MLASAAVGVAGLAGCSEVPDVSSVVEDDPDSNENTDNDDPESQDDDVQDTSSNEESHERVDPEDTGLVVTQTAITSITIEDTWVILSATVTIQNEGRFEYELVEIRTDAYRTTPDAAQKMQSDLRIQWKYLVVAHRLQAEPNSCKSKSPSHATRPHVS